MIVKKRWTKRIRRELRGGGGYRYDLDVWEGWFLFGVLPLYIRQVA